MAKTLSYLKTNLNLMITLNLDGQLTLPVFNETFDKYIQSMADINTLTTVNPAHVPYVQQAETSEVLREVLGLDKQINDLSGPSNSLFDNITDDYLQNSSGYNDSNTIDGHNALSIEASSSGLAEPFRLQNSIDDLNSYNYTRNPLNSIDENPDNRDQLADTSLNSNSLGDLAFIETGVPIIPETTEITNNTSKGSTLYERFLPEGTDAGNGPTSISGQLHLSDNYGLHSLVLSDGSLSNTDHSYKLNLTNPSSFIGHPYSFDLGTLTINSLTGNDVNDILSYTFHLLGPVINGMISNPIESINAALNGRAAVHVPITIIHDQPVDSNDSAPVIVHLTNNTINVNDGFTAPNTTPNAHNNSFYNGVNYDGNAHTLMGNVLNNDKAGADGYVVGNHLTSNPITSATYAGNHLTLGQTYTTDFGSILLNKDGSYTYTLDTAKIAAADPHPQGLFSTTETIHYITTDQNGNMSNADLIIPINVDNNIASLSSPMNNNNSVNGAGIVYEAGLSVIGSDPNNTRNQNHPTTTSGSFTVNASDGLSNDTLNITYNDSTGTHTIVLNNPQASTSRTSTTLQTADGILNITLTATTYDNNSNITSERADYTYTLNQAPLNDANGNNPIDHFGITLKDANGNVIGSNNLDISIKPDAPTAHDDYNVSNQDQTGNTPSHVSGNIITGQGETDAAGKPNNTRGADTFGADGQGTYGSYTVSSIQVYSAATNNYGSLQTLANNGGDTIIKGYYGELHISSNGQYTYEPYTPQQFQQDPDNDHLVSSAGGIEKFEYTAIDANGTATRAFLDITVNSTGIVPVGYMPGSPTTITGTVFESGLDNSYTGTDAGNVSGNHPITTTGSFVISDSQGLNDDSLKINYTDSQGSHTKSISANDITNNQTQIIMTADGVLTLKFGDFIHNSNGSITSTTVDYNYMLTGAPLNTIDHVTDAIIVPSNDFHFTLLDGSGQEISSNLLDIKLTPDTPVIRPDVNSLTNGEGNNSSVSGNIFTGANELDGKGNRNTSGIPDSGQDTPGADGTGNHSYTLYSIQGADDSKTLLAALATTTSYGKYGMLILSSDGSYTYQLYNVNDIHYMPITHNSQDVFYYQGQDSNGPTSKTTLTFNVNLPTQDMDTLSTSPITVHQEYLPTGSHAADTSHNDTQQINTFSIDAPAGLDKIVFTQGDNSTVMITAHRLETSDSNPILINTGFGTITITGYVPNLDPVTGIDYGGKVTYEYKETSAAIGMMIDATPLTVYGLSGTSTTGALQTRLIYDAPQGVDDNNLYVTDQAQQNPAYDISGNVLFGTPGKVAGADILGADGQTINGVEHYNLTSVQGMNDTNAVTFTNMSSHSTISNGAYGYLIIDPMGNYTYHTYDDAHPNPSNNPLSINSNGAVDYFTYTSADGNGTLTQALLTIDISGTQTGIRIIQPAPDLEVDEKYLPGDITHPAGTAHNDATPATLHPSTTVSFSTPYGYQNIVFTQNNGSLVTVTAAQLEGLNNGTTPPITIHTQYGYVQITGYDYNAYQGSINDYGGTITYNYTLNGPVINGSPDNIYDNLNYTINSTSKIGSQFSLDSTLAFQIVPDAPQTIGEAATINYGTNDHMVTTFNSMTNDAKDTSYSGGSVNNQTITGHLLANDVPGADGPANVINIIYNGHTYNAGETVNAQYGTLTFSSDGTYSYTVNQNSVLNAGQSMLADKFTYTVADQNNSLSSSVLEIDINNLSTNGNSVTGPAVSAATAPQADQAYLPSVGSQSANATYDEQHPSSSFTVNAPNGLDHLTFTQGNGTLVTVTAAQLEGLTNGSTTIPPINTQYGQIQIIGFIENKDSAGHDIGGTITYNYTLNGPVVTGNTNPVADNIMFTINNSDENYTLDAVVKPDYDKAVADNNVLTSGTGAMLSVSGNILTGAGETDAQGHANNTAGKDVPGADGQNGNYVVHTLSGADGTAVAVPASGTVTVYGIYGQAVISNDGTYTYTLYTENDSHYTKPLPQGAQDIFTYIAIDGNNTPTQPVTLTITSTIMENNAVLIPSTTPTQGGTATPDLPEVSESHLSTGSDPNMADLTSAKTLNIQSTQGIHDLQLNSNGHNLIIPDATLQQLANGTYTGPALSIQSQYGTFTITGYTPNASNDGSDHGGTINYTYTLTTAAPNGMAGANNDAMTVTLTDIYGNASVPTVFTATIDHDHITTMPDTVNVDPSQGGVGLGSAATQPNFVTGANESGPQQSNGQPAGADILGADGQGGNYTVYTIQAGAFSGTNNSPIYTVGSTTQAPLVYGTYGYLQLNNPSQSNTYGGNYTYKLYSVDDPHFTTTIPAAGATEAFNYTLKDANGVISNDSNIIINIGAPEPITATASGNADYYASTIAIPSGITYFPNLQESHALTSQQVANAQASKYIVQSTHDVVVTFEDEGAGNKNSLLYAIIDPTTGMISNVTPIWTNASKNSGGGGDLTPLVSTYDIGTVTKGLQLDFILVPNGYNTNNWTNPIEANYIDLTKGTLQLLDSQGHAVNTSSQSEYLWYIPKDGSTGFELVSSSGNDGHAIFSTAAAQYTNLVSSDGLVHTINAYTDNSGTVITGFEDVYKGGDKDYNDILFQTNLATPQSTVTTATNNFAIDNIDLTLSKTSTLNSAVMEIHSGAHNGDILDLQNVTLGTANASGWRAVTLADGTPTNIFEKGNDTGQILFTGNDSEAHYQAVFNDVHLKSSSGNLEDGTRNLSLTVTDANGVTGRDDDITFRVTNTNDFNNITDSTGKAESGYLITTSAPNDGASYVISTVMGSQLPAMDNPASHTLLVDINGGNVTLNTDVQANGIQNVKTVDLSDAKGITFNLGEAAAQHLVDASKTLSINDRPGSSNTVVLDKNWTQVSDSYHYTSTNDHINLIISQNIHAVHVGG